MLVIRRAVIKNWKPIAEPGNLEEMRNERRNPRDMYLSDNLVQATILLHNYKHKRFFKLYTEK